MSKKNFKDNTAGIDRFFSSPEPRQARAAPDTRGARYRINLKLRPEFKEYLTEESWKSRKSVTEYVNDLIQADKDAKNV